MVCQDMCYLVSICGDSNTRELPLEYRVPCSLDVPNSERIPYQEVVDLRAPVKQNEIFTPKSNQSLQHPEKKTTNWYKLVSSCFQSQFHEHVISSGNASLLYQSSAVLIDEETGNLQVNKAPHWSPFMAGWWLWKCELTMVYGRYNELVDGDCNGL